jgi:Pyruvate/2-oxoacid:ferredoxin oxidoreductase gamma subunit
MRTLKLILIPLAILFLLAFILFLVAQIANLVYLADRVDPLLGDIVLFVLIAVVVALLVIPLYTYLSLPKAILPPQSNEVEAVRAYQSSLVHRYSQNRLLRRQGLKVQNMEDVNQGVKILDSQADKVIQYNTVRVFAGTAISQNGAFDSMIVFYFATNTLWRVSRIYFQRSTLRQLLKLYSNIALIVIGARLMEDQLDEYLEENIEEFLQEMTSQGAETTASAGARATKIIPGLGTVVESLVQGTFNGLMVLRIGLITKKYCGATNAINRKALRRESFFEARKQIFKILALPRKEFMQRFDLFANFFKKKARTP